MAKKALITGISGQDGVFLAKELLRLGYRVTGLTRSVTNAKLSLPEDLASVNLIETKYSKSDLQKIVKEIGPDEIYHFAAQPYVGKSWSLIDETLSGTALLTAHLLETLVSYPHIKFFNASSSEIFADSTDAVTEDFIKIPTNPYGCAKLFSFHMVQAYRENYGLFAVNGIFFNHESERRHSDFFSQKLVSGVLDVYSKKVDVVKLGNLNVVRDWGSAEEYMSVVPKLLQEETPCDINICSGKGTEVLELVKSTFSLLNLDYQKWVTIDPSFVRNKEKKIVIGSNQKISKLLHWTPKISAEAVFKNMLNFQAKKRGIHEIS